MLQSDRNDRNRNETEYRRKHYALSREFDVCVVSLAEYYGKHRARHGRFHDDDCSEQRSSADDQLDEYQSYCRRDEELEQADQVGRLAREHVLEAYAGQVCADDHHGQRARCVADCLNRSADDRWKREAAYVEQNSDEYAYEAPSCPKSPFSTGSPRNPVFPKTIMNAIIPLWEAGSLMTDVSILEMIIAMMTTPMKISTT